MPTWFNGVLRNKFATQEIANAFANTDARLAALRALSAAAHKGRAEERERLARDEIAALMRSLRCDLCGYPVVDCRYDGSKLPFAGEVTG
jgi:hypothetical protein